MLGRPPKAWRSLAHYEEKDRPSLCLLLSFSDTALRGWGDDPPRLSVTVTAGVWLRPYGEREQPRNLGYTISSSHPLAGWAWSYEMDPSRAYLYEREYLTAGQPSGAEVVSAASFWSAYLRRDQAARDTLGRVQHPYVDQEAAQRVIRLGLVLGIDHFALPASETPWRGLQGDLTIDPWERYAIGLAPSALANVWTAFRKEKGVPVEA